MATPTYDLLDSVTLSSSASSVTFSSIDQSYRDLVLVTDVIATAAFNLAIRLNNDSGANYSYVLMRGNGSAASSASGTGSNAYFTPFITITSGQSDQVSMQILDYSATDKHKSILTRDNTPAQQTIAMASRWASTSAVNEIDLLELNGNGFPAGSTFYLYGVAA